MKSFFAVAFATATYAAEGDKAADMPKTDPRLEDIDEPFKSLLPADCWLVPEE